VLNEIAKAENIDATEEELMERAKEMAKQYGDKEIEKTTKLIMDAQRSLLKIDVINEKVIKLLVDSSKVIA